MKNVKVEKKKMRLVQNYEPDHRSFEKVSDKKSLTVPDDSYSLKELITKFVRGQRVDVRTRDGQYYLDEKSADFDALDLEKVGQMDIHDRSEIASDLAEKNRLAAKKFSDEENRRKQKQKEDSEIMSDLKKDFIEKKKSGAAGGPDPAGSQAPPKKEGA